MSMTALSRFRSGDLVEVRSEQEILQTLDERGMLDGMPFMPEMLQYCGRQFRVGKSAHKTCDTMHYTGIRRVSSAVHLENLRCDGSAHGGCQAECLLFWKDAWLKPAGATQPRTGKGRSGAGCTRDQLLAAVRPDGDRYQCQVTELLNMSSPWAWWNPMQYWADVRKRNYPAGEAVLILLLAALRRMIFKFPNYPVLVKIYNALAGRFGKPRHFTREQLRGPIPKGGLTPGGELQLQAGDWVRVLPAEQIVATLSNHRNKGLTFDTEMYPYCGGTFQVRGIVTRLIDEPTGRMMEMRNPCVKLEGVICRSEYSEQRFLCPRSIIPYWRPLWLEKVEPPHKGACQ